MRITEWPESRRRLFALSVALLFVALGFFIAVGNISETPPDQHASLWRLFAVTAVSVGLLMGWYSWRKLTSAAFDTKLKVEGTKILLPAIALALVITRLLPDEGAAPIVGGGVAAGFFGGVLVVYGFDALTDRLSKGRSWGAGAEQQRGGQSNTSSPT